MFIDITYMEYSICYWSGVFFLSVVMELKKN